MVLFVINNLGRKSSVLLWGTLAGELEKKYCGINLTQTGHNKSNIPLLMEHAVIKICPLSGSHIFNDSLPE